MYNGQSCVDYVLFSPNLINDIEMFTVEPQTEYSDHCPVTFMLKCDMLCMFMDVNLANGQNRMIWDIEKKDVFLNNLVRPERTEELNSLLNFLSSADGNEEDVNKAVSIFVETVRKAADPLFLRQPLGKYVHQKPSDDIPVWANVEFRSKKKMFYKCRDKQRKHPCDDNRLAMIRARSEYKLTCKKQRRGYETKQTKKLLHAKLNNIKEYWKLLSRNGNTKNSTRVTIDEFFNHFVSLSNPNGDFYVADDDVMSNMNALLNDDLCEMFQELNMPILDSEVIWAVKELKCGKSCGEDLVLNEFFIHGKDHLVEFITPLFNFIFDSGHFPDQWSNGLLVPLHKFGNYSSPNNFRGITLLSMLGKLFTRVINNRLDKWAEAYGVYIEAQFGFRSGRGTVDCIYVLHMLIEKFLQSGKRLYSFFIDYSKAFDYVVHENLWYKLLQCGLKGKILNIIMSMYRCVRSKVYSNGQVSESFACKLGVRQGECLSPFLFAVYVNDLEYNMRNTGAGVTVNDMKIFLLLYADDAVIFSEISTGLQSGVNELQKYCERWKLTLNTTKSRCGFS